MTHDPDQHASLGAMYSDYFLDYACYVILERAVPHLYDGLKPVQRRILHAMDEIDDGRYNKVAGIVGNTMNYHPHGDQSIGAAIVGLGQKDLLIDTQGNWGNTLTGDGAAAPRYIEARLTKFAIEVVFNPKTTNWLPSYDGRRKEPDTLPVKFPLLLAQGVEGIAVGLACKVLPHNFNELIEASIAVLRNEAVHPAAGFPHRRHHGCQRLPRRPARRQGPRPRPHFHREKGHAAHHRDPLRHHHRRADGFDRRRRRQGQDQDRRRSRTTPPPTPTSSSTCPPERIRKRRATRSSPSPIAS